ncbi:hypothetical protein OXX79_001059 [Metschnikowia pulcherrima]
MVAFLRAMKRPFSNLSPEQKPLALVRVGSSVLVALLIIVIFVLEKFPLAIPIAHINCAHLDVAYGLYQSLRLSMTESVLNKGASDNVLPIDSGLSDSEISILTKYAQTQVSNAPQQFAMGAAGWCSVSYVTDFSDMNNVYTNKTIRCQPYEGFDFYDYRTLLSSNQLQVILAYAYEGNNAQSAEYRDRVKTRSKRYAAMKVVYAVQLAQQVVLAVAGVVIYGNRGGSRDLSSTSKPLLNAVAILALASGITMVVSSAVVIGDLFAMKREIKRGLGDFGISMGIGTLFMATAWLALAAACVCMSSWTIPLWCSNPPTDLGENEQLFHATKTGSNNVFKVKPYQLNRKTQPSARTSSRLFDHLEDSFESAETSSEPGNPFHDPFSEPIEASSAIEQSDGSSSDLTKNSKIVHTEHELRRLGEKLSRNVSVRQLGGPRRSKRVPEHLLLHKKDTHELLYGQNPFSNHQYPQAFAKPLDSPSLSRAASLTYDTKPADAPRTRHLSDDQFALPRPGLKERHASFNSDSASVLDEAEMAYLDNNRFMNHLPE